MPQPLREGEVVAAYMEFDRTANSRWRSAEYLLRFGAHVSQRTVQATEVQLARLAAERAAADAELATWRKVFPKAVGAIQGMAGRQSPTHAEVDRGPWQTMSSAPKDGTAFLALLDSSDIPHAVRWLQAGDDRGSDKEGWHLTWDGDRISEHSPLRYWMPCPNDPDSKLLPLTKGST